MRNHRRAAYGERTGYEQMTTPPVPLDHKACPDQTLVEHAKRAWDRALDARRSARLSQCAVDRGGADRHHRPGDGLRHHRHRARFRAGEVQEARRRRLFQDHQPRRAGSLARARLQRERHRRDRGLCRRSRHAGPGAGDQSRHAQGQGLYAARRSRKWKRRCRPRSISNSPSTSGRSAPTSCATNSASSRRPRRAEFRPPRPSRLHQARDRGRQHPCLRRHDGRRRAASEGRALRRVRLRQSVRPHRQALSLGRQPYPHAGGGAAVHLRRHLQDHQHAERGRRSRTARRPISCPGSSGSKPTRSTATARSCRSRCNRSSSPTTTKTTTSSRPSSRSRRRRAPRR